MMILPDTKVLYHTYDDEVEILACEQACGCIDTDIYVKNDSYSPYVSTSVCDEHLPVFKYLS